jgi:hypothetical protein
MSNSLWMTGDGWSEFMAASRLMAQVFIGSEAVAAGRVTKYQLAKDYQRVLPDIYAPKGDLLLDDSIRAAWKWSRGRGIISGVTASAWHGAKWVDAGTPVELNLVNRKRPPGVILRNDTIFDDEVMIRRGIAVTTVAPHRLRSGSPRRREGVRRQSRCVGSCHPLRPRRRPRRGTAASAPQRPAPGTRSAGEKRCRGRVAARDIAAFGPGRRGFSSTADPDSGAPTQWPPLLPRHGLAGIDGGRRI